MEMEGWAVGNLPSFRWCCWASSCTNQARSCCARATSPCSQASSCNEPCSFLIGTCNDDVTSHVSVTCCDEECTWFDVRVEDRMSEEVSLSQKVAFQVACFRCAFLNVLLQQTLYSSAMQSKCGKYWEKLTRVSLHPNTCNKTLKSWRSTVSSTDMPTCNRSTVGQGHKKHQVETHLVLKYWRRRRRSIGGWFCWRLLARALRSSQLVALSMCRRMSLFQHCVLPFEKLRIQKSTQCLPNYQFFWNVWNFIFKFVLCVSLPWWRRHAALCVRKPMSRRPVGPWYTAYMADIFARSA